MSYEPILLDGARAVFGAAALYVNLYEDNPWDKIRI